MSEIIKKFKAEGVKFADLRFTDTLGKEHHVTVPLDIIDADFLHSGKAFDGSSIAGWCPIHHSELLLVPDLQTAVLDPFYVDATLILRCDVVDPTTGDYYQNDPRAIARKAEAYLVSTGIADACLVGPEPEFFIFDDVGWQNDMNGASYRVNSKEAAWNSAEVFVDGNMGHRTTVKGGYFPVPPVDSSQDIRSAMALTLAEMGIVVEAHHHEVATSNQNEIATRFNSLLLKADEIQILKYVVHNTAHEFGKTATFMPKPLVGDNGSGMHCHLSLSKAGENLFAGGEYAHLSETALFFIGGIIKHARALNVFTNPSTNSYKRLVPGFEAPVMLAYAAHNRSAAIRIPHTSQVKARRIEVRFPDPTANPYLAFSALLMAGLDGIQKRIHPGKPLDEDLYELSPKEASRIPTVCDSLEQAIACMNDDREFLLQGGVFTHATLDAYVSLKQAQINRLRMATHPLEFEMYYSL